MQPELVYRFGVKSSLRVFMHILSCDVDVRQLVKQTLFMNFVTRSMNITKFELSSVAKCLY